jgi:hypothetical protein
MRYLKPESATLEADFVFTGSPAFGAIADIFLGGTNGIFWDICEPENQFDRYPTDPCDA